jgi:K+-transporting ATPase ATPase C chain
MPEALRQVLTGLRVLLLLTVVLGLGYPLAVLGAGFAFEHQRTGSLITSNGQVVGSSLIAQQVGAEGWFQPRPSAVDYDAQGSGGSNAGPSNPDLAATVEQRRLEVATREAVPPADVPPDAVTASGSGLDPYISPEYAELQVPRVARERAVPVDRVQAVVDRHTQGRLLGFLGQPRVNVVELNLALRDLS